MEDLWDQMADMLRLTYCYKKLYIDGHRYNACLLS